MEADLWDVGLDLWAWRSTPRRHVVITTQLRPGARVWQARLDDRMLTPSQYLTLRLLDAVAHETWVIANKDVDKSKRTKPPKPQPRPADARAARARDAREQARATRGIAWVRRAERVRAQQRAESGP